jgi:hypothetical protein
MTLAANGYPTKKALKAAVGQRLHYKETSFHNVEYKRDGLVFVVGPDPVSRKWFAQVTLENGIITKVT